MKNFFYNAAFVLLCIAGIIFGAWLGQLGRLF